MSGPERAGTAVTSGHPRPTRTALPLDEVHGRVAATLALVYPAGIGVVVPGERWDDRAAPMIAYLKLFEESYAQFPGFTNEIQGVFPSKIGTAASASRPPVHLRHQGIAGPRRGLH